MTDAPPLIVAVEDHVLTITLNRPERRNAFTRPMIALWADTLAQARQDPDVHVIVVTGAGDAFCAGFDMKAARPPEEAARDDPDAIELFPQRIALAMEDLDKPVIAAVNGVAVGAGLGLALTADLRFFSDRAQVWEAYVNVGIFPGAGDTWFLPRIVGTSRALKMLWTGEKVPADDALAMGLADAVYAHDALLPETLAFARALAARPQLIVRGIKRAVHASQRSSLRDALGLAGTYTRALSAGKGSASAPTKDRP